MKRPKVMIQASLPGRRFHRLSEQFPELEFVDAMQPAVLSEQLASAVIWSTAIEKWLLMP